MSNTDVNLNERLSNLLRHDVRFILKDNVLKSEYVELHEIIEGYKPSCTGCSAKSRLKAWKAKVKTFNIVKQVKTKEMKNTFKLKKGRLRVTIPFVGAVITPTSKDELVQFYLDGANTDEERKRREAFFEVLPEPKKKRGRKPKKVEDVKEESEVVETKKD